MRSALAAIVVLGCGGQHAVPKPVTKTIIVDAGGDADAAIADAGPPKIELLAQKHDRVAPGMREIEKREVDLGKDHELAIAAFDKDTCVRAAFDADAPTSVMLVNAHGTTLATADATEALVGAQGPICFKKGDVATFRFNGQSRVRIVVWSSP